MTRSKAEPPVFVLVDRLRSAARTGRRLHLDPEHVNVLMDEEIYLVLSKLEARAMRSLSGPAASNGSSSVSSGSGSARSSLPGTSAGSSGIPLDAASRGASQLLRREVALTTRRKKQSMPSLPTT